MEIANKYLILKFLIFTMFTCILKIQGQTVSIKGKIVDKQTLEAVPFAHVIIENTQIGAISDLYGDFILNYPRQYQTSMLRISCLGYKPIKISLHSVKQSASKIMLEQNVVQLNEVIVKPEDPLDLLKEAVRKIPENYDTTANMLSGYYKMSSLLADKTIKYTEAFIDIFKFPDHGYREDGKPLGDSISLREVRIKASEIKDWKLNAMLPWEKSIYNLPHRDVVKEFSSEKNAFNKFVRSYKFDIEKMILINGRRTFKIRVTPKKNKKHAYWNGHIYIDELSMAFVKVDFISTDILFKKLKRHLPYILASKLYKVNYDAGEWKESINFQLIGDKWYFNEVNSSRYFLVSSKKRNMDRVPVNVTLHYGTDSVKSNVVYSDTLDFLNPQERWWIKEKYIANKYRDSFWEAFDQQRGIVSDDVFLGKNDSINQKKEGYTFTRLDTLQGALTPLRTCFDVGFYHLDVELLPGQEIIKGNSLIRFKVVDPADRIQIDLYSGMSVDSIIYRGKMLGFEREFNAIYVDFPETLRRDSVEEINVYFSGRPVDFDPEIPLYASFLWVEDLNGNPWLQAICQGYGASGWWPNKDHLSDEPDSAAISITVPPDLNVVANGRLRNRTPLENGKTRFDWFVSYPINNYNLTLNAGKYAHFQDKYTNGTDTLDLDYHVMPYNLERAKKKTKMVKPMLRTYEKFFGAYPFPRDGFKLVETPHAMEHQSCVALGFEYFAEPDDADPETTQPDFGSGDIDFQIVLHETAHEWWGNSVSCTDNAELWIHEAFATYAEALYIEDHYGYANSQIYLNAMKQWVNNKTPIIGKFNVNHIHYDISDMYYKGALMLNTFRHMIDNDSVWFSLLKGIQSEFKYKIVTTEHIVQYINQNTGTDCTWFFDQYLRNTGIPKLELAFENNKGKKLMKYRWVADVNGFKMPVKYTVGKGVPGLLHPTVNWKKVELPESGKEEVNVNTEQFYINVEVKDATP